jgi:WD repeat-containing protein 34
VPVVDDGRF